MTRTKALWGLAATSSLFATYLHFTREPSPPELGWRLAHALQARDAGAVASMFQDEELSALGLSRAQAARIVSEVVMPDADLYGAGVSRITMNGNHLAFERPKGDPRYFVPPKIVFASGPNGERFLSLGQLLASVWGNRRAAFALGMTTLDPKPQVRREYQRARELGMTKVMDWSKHEVVDAPAEPVGF